jgi:hypothetical protein
MLPPEDRVSGMNFAQVSALIETLEGLEKHEAQLRTTFETAVQVLQAQQEEIKEELRAHGLRSSKHWRHDKCGGVIVLIDADTLQCLRCYSQRRATVYQSADGTCRIAFAAGQ